MERHERGRLFLIAVLASKNESDVDMTLIRMVGLVGLYTLGSIDLKSNPFPLPKM